MSSVSSELAGSSAGYNAGSANRQARFMPFAHRFCLSPGSRPSPHVRVLIVRGWANRRAGKGRPAWDDSSREGRTVHSIVGLTLFSRYLTRCFWQRVEAKSKTMGCCVRIGSPLFDLPTPAQLKRARKGKAWNHR